MTRTQTLLFTFFSALYIGLSSAGVEFMPWLIKIIPIGLLLWPVLQKPGFAGKLLLTLALCFSALGDVLLALDYFTLGLAAFLVAQLHYATFFARNWQGLSRRWPASAALIVYVLIMAWLLTPHLGDLRVPVFAYLTVIFIMGLMALQSRLSILWAPLGALVFISSDSLIAINKFMHPVPYERVLIMVTYYAAQWMLVQGILVFRSKNHQTEYTAG